MVIERRKGFCRITSTLHRPLEDFKADFTKVSRKWRYKYYVVASHDVSTDTVEVIIARW